MRFQIKITSYVVSREINHDSRSNHTVNNNFCVLCGCKNSEKN